MKKSCYIGIDVGSVSAKVVLLGKDMNILKYYYERTNGKVLDTVRKIFNKIGASYKIEGCGVTGSGRVFIGKIVGADVIKNEITAHASALSHFYPKANTIIEIGGQDSKIIIFRNGVPVDFAMNSVCAAGTGSFLDQQATRLGIKIEEFGKIALKSKKAINIGGRCTVFAESEMIQKQQLGFNRADIINGLCMALVRNYLNDVAKGKELKPPFIFLGGVAANVGIKKAFEKVLKVKITVPKYHNIMGAIGMALIVAKKNIEQTKFRGLTIPEVKIENFVCKKCNNNCEILKVVIEGEPAYLGSRCGRWDSF